MNAHALAHAAYANPNMAQKSARSAEYDVISRITSRLRTASRNAEKNYPALVEALDENRRLWIALASDVANPENSLPRALKAEILSLAQFTLRHTAAILTGDERPDVLVEINLSILRGLAGKEDIK
ncbi:MAG: flagellar biosynthesis regulatory protein FlaF [Rhodobacteraceae bacterium]|nr:MAG: flagellar biosynthesis regulatory protein FlaF [Paracoccaceae bacterium]